MSARQIIFLFCGIAPALTIFAKEEKTVLLFATSPAVQKIINSQIGAGKLEMISEYSQDGENVFDVDFTDKNNQDGGFTVADDGTLLSVEVALNATPAAVQKTIHAQAAGFDLESIDKNLDDTEISYDVDVTIGGKEKSFTVADDGTLESMQVDLAETPAAVQKTIQEELRGSVATEIDKNFDDEITYDVATNSSGKEKSFTVAADGTLASREVQLQEIRPGARRAIKEKIGDGKILRIDQSLSETKGGVQPYEVEGRKDGKPFDFSVGPRGRFLGMN